MELNVGKPSTTASGATTKRKVASPLVKKLESRQVASRSKAHIWTVEDTEELARRHDKGMCVTRFRLGDKNVSAAAYEYDGNAPFKMKLKDEYDQHGQRVVGPRFVPKGHKADLFLFGKTVEAVKDEMVDPTDKNLVNVLMNLFEKDYFIVGAKERLQEILSNTQLYEDNKQELDDDTKEAVRQLRDAHIATNEDIAGNKTSTEKDSAVFQVNSVRIANVNSELRKPNPDPNAIVEKNLLCNILNILLPQPGILYRGIKLPREALGLQAWIRSLFESRVYQDKGFTSASLLRSVAEASTGYSTRQSTDQHILFCIQHKTGRCIKYYVADDKKGEEFLFLPLTKFDILGWTEQIKGIFWIVDMREQ